MSLPLDRNVPAEEPEKQNVYWPTTKTLFLAEFERGFPRWWFLPPPPIQRKSPNKRILLISTRLQSLENIPGPVKRVRDYPSPVV